MSMPITSNFLLSLIESSILTKDVNQNALLDELLISLSKDGFEFCHQERRLSSKSSESIFLNLFLVLMCVVMAGLASGLTQGLLSLDYMEMKIKAQSGTPKEKENAAKVLPIISNHHLLLVSLMLWNATATEALPLFLDKVVPEYIAIIISVTLVLMFGEIIPASILTGPNQLQIAANFTPMVYGVLTIFFPIAYPISLLLDYIIGHEGSMTMYNKKELVTMIKLQHEEGVKQASHGNRLQGIMDHQEVAIVGGALTFREMTAEQVMTPSSQVFMLSIHETLTYKILHGIFTEGYSRIPIYDKDKDDIVSIILTRDLVFVDPDDNMPVANFVKSFGRTPIVVWHDDTLGNILTIFRTERLHIAVVRDVETSGTGDPFYKVVGIITLEDIIEEILGAEIEDETDSIASDIPNNQIEPQKLLISNNYLENIKLSYNEIISIVDYLRTSNSDIKSVAEKNNFDLQQLIQNAAVINLKKSTLPENNTILAEDYLFTRGKITNKCILLLKGQVKLQYDNESQEKILGPWDILCLDALIQPEGTYSPEFSAYIISDELKFIRISAFHNLKTPKHPTQKKKKQDPSAKSKKTNKDLSQKFNNSSSFDYTNSSKDQQTLFLLEPGTKKESIIRKINFDFILPNWNIFDGNTTNNHAQSKTSSLSKVNFKDSNEYQSISTVSNPILSHDEIV